MIEFLTAEGPDDGYGLPKQWVSWQQFDIETNESWHFVDYYDGGMSIIAETFGGIGMDIGSGFIPTNWALVTVYSGASESRQDSVPNSKEQL